MQPIIFCDFDGTITATDNIVSLMTHFAPVESEKIAQAMFAKTITFKDGITAMFELLSSHQKDEVIEYLLHTAVIREGFSEFVQFAQINDIPFYVVSGGVDFFIKPMLEQFGPFSGVYCNSADFSGSQIELLFPNTCDEACTKYEVQGCGCCKPSVMRTVSQENQFKIVIGDSISDYEAAKQADLVLARDHLIGLCEELQIPYKPFETFYDCIDAVKELIEV